MFGAAAKNGKGEYIVKKPYVTTMFYLVRCYTWQ